MARLRFQIAATNYVLKDGTADQLNFLVGSDRDKFEIEWPALVPAGFPYGLAAGDIVLIDIKDAGYDLDGGTSLREFYVTNPDLRPGKEAIELSWYPLRRLPLSNAPIGAPLYPFYVNEPAFTEFSPTLSNYNIDYSKEEEHIFFRKAFEGDFIVGQDGADFTFLNDLRDSGFPYRIFVKIQRMCGGSWTDEIEGFFTIAQCAFDFDRCTVTFPIFTTDKYERILNNESFEINIQNIATKYTATFITTLYKNGMKLGDVLEYLLVRYAPQIETVESVFFNINNPFDFAYDAAIDLTIVENLLLFAPSDFRFPTAPAAATITNITLTQLLQALKILFNADWYITGSTFRIEHFSYFLQAGTDLSGKTRIVKNIQKTDVTNLPIAQRFKVKENLNQPYGRGYLINWDDELKYLNSGGSVEEKRADAVTVDVVWYRDLFLGNITTPEPDLTAGFVLYNPLITTVNNPPAFDTALAPKFLSWNILLQNFFIFDAIGRTYVARTSDVSGVDLQGESYQILTDIQHRRERTLVEGIIFDNCCDVFDPIFKVTTTEYGEVRIVERATHNLQGDTIETNIKF